MKIIPVLLLVLFVFNCKHIDEKENFTEKKSEKVNLQTEDINQIELEVYDFNDFKKFLNKKDDKVYVINFWATWCAPCVKELPFFEKLNTEYNNKNVEVILVSLDFPHLYDKKLKPFIIDKKIASKVVALNDVDMNTWIPKVSENWSGSIPATIIYKNDKKYFYEQSFNYEELKKEVEQFLNLTI